MAVGLQLAGKNDFVKVQENINNNLTKLDNQIDFNLLATLGIEYGGILNDSNAKISGKAYYDQTGKKLYKCTANTSLNYADASYFVELSNNDLLGKLQNLVYSEPLSGLTITKNNRTVVITYDGPTSNLLSFIFPKEFRPYKEIKFYVFRGVYPASTNTPVSCMQLSISDNGAIKISRNVNNGSGGDVSNHIDSLYVSYISQD